MLYTLFTLDALQDQRRLSVTNLSSETTLHMFHPNSNDVYPQKFMAINGSVRSHFFTSAVMMTGAFS